LPFFLGEIKNRDLKLRVCACFFFLKNKVTNKGRYQFGPCTI
jgi:hypothetical protein